MSLKSRSRVTRDDIARAAGVSTAVVSYVINGGPRRVRESTRARVLKCIEELGYHPNAVARGLRTSRTGTLALVFVDFETEMDQGRPLSSVARHFLTEPYISTLIAGVGAAAKSQSYHTLLALIERNGMDQLHDLAKGRLADGLILRQISPPAREGLIIEEIRESGIPVVVFEPPEVKRPDFPYVAFDDFAGARAAVRYLVAKGHRRIAHLCGDLRFRSARERLRGYRAALEEAGLRAESELIVETGWVKEHAVRATRALLALRRPPTAIFAASDMLAAGVYRAATDSGRKIPDDLAVIGCDDSPLAQHLVPSLTTIHLPLEEAAREAVRLLFSLIEGEDSVSRHVVLQGSLVVRESA